MQRHKFALLLAVFILGSSPAALAGTGNDVPANTGAHPLKLQGRAEVEDKHDGMEAYRASMSYRKGAVALAGNDYKLAASCFKSAGDGFAGTAGTGKFEAESRYAEAQACRLAKEDAESERLFQVAVELFKKYDPGNPYLKSGVGYLEKMEKTTKLRAKAVQAQADAQLQSMPGMLTSVDRNVPLKGKLTRLEGKLKDGDLFAGSHFLNEAASADVSDPYVKDNVYKCFIKMNCQESTALGGNYYTAPDSYKAFKSSGKTVVIGATDDGWNPTIKLKLNNKDYGVSMYLPGLAKSSKNVLLVTDNRHVLAIDPRKQDIWNLVTSFTPTGADFSWGKLTHIKKK